MIPRSQMRTDVTPGAARFNLAGMPNRPPMRGMNMAGNVPPTPQQRIDPLAAAPSYPRRNLLLNMPIAWRLTLGFLLAALIAASASAFSGIQRAQTLDHEASFYQSLLAANTTLNNGASYLQLMNSETQKMLIDASAVPPSTETLQQDQSAITHLISLYEGVSQDYLKNQLLSQHPDQVALVAESGQSGLPSQQRILGASMQRTWQVYRDALQQVLADIAQGQVADADVSVRAQAEPTNTDALSALHAVIQFDGLLAGAVHDAANVEQYNQTVTSVAVALVAFALIAIVGWVISDTLVRRLRLLKRVAESVEQGEVSARVAVVGTDEIGKVSGSVNGMLDTIVGLLDVTRKQRDALQNAAERLFADVRVAGTGDLRVNAAVGSDPIGMLANAFNFTVNRFRRFVMRTQNTLDQLDLSSRQALQQADTFLIATRALMRGQQNRSHISFPPFQSGIDSGQRLSQVSRSRNQNVPTDASDASMHVAHARDVLGKIAREGVNYHARAVLDLAEQAYLSAGRVTQLAVTAYNVGAPGATPSVTQAQMDELRTLGVLITRLGSEANAIQKNAVAGLSELDSTLSAIDDAWNAPRAANAEVVFPGPQAAQPVQQVGSESSVDVLKLSHDFAEEVVALSQQMMILTREMRAHMVQFRLDPSGREMDVPMYTPGTY